MLSGIDIDRRLLPMATARSVQQMAGHSAVSCVITVENKNFTRFAFHFQQCPQADCH
jgi:hypothetical protein